MSSCAPASLLNALVPSGTYILSDGIPYGEGPRRRLDVYRPGEAGPGPRPVVVFFYGGSWQNGNRADYRFVGEALAAMGFVAVLPDYRLHPDGLFPGFVEDGAAAVRWRSPMPRAMAATRRASWSWVIRPARTSRHCWRSIAAMAPWT
jgi:acetyl esterase/lipase